MSAAVVNTAAAILGAIGFLALVIAFGSMTMNGAGSSTPPGWLLAIGGVCLLTLLAMGVK